MADIPNDYGSGGAGLTGPESGSRRHPSIAKVTRDVADDLETLRAQFNALLAKLDADSGVGDTNYVATLQVASGTVKTKKV